MVRTLVVWCPDWPVVAGASASGLAHDVPAAIVASGRVLACSTAARAEGVRRGLRRREAQRRCPGLVVLDRDLASEARVFEPVVAAVESLAPSVEVIRPGMCALAVRGPARYFGGDRAAAGRIVSHVATACDVRVQAGVADGPFAAELAARQSEIVPSGQTRAFLAPFGVEVLDRPELADLLRRLGLGTLGAFAALPAGDVLTRFGADGAAAHRLARGLDERPLAARVPPPELAVHAEFDPPVERLDTAAFVARSLAEELAGRLARFGLACVRLAIEAHTEHGERLTRLWRHDGAPTAGGIADRVRWQLDGWLSGRTGGGPIRGGPIRGGPIGGGPIRGGPTAGLVLLRLAPDEVVPDHGRQLTLWGGFDERAERAGRALARVQGLLGPRAVVTAVLGGGRAPGERVRFVPWGDERRPAGIPERRRGEPAAPPWPGRLPPPSPATVPADPWPARVLDAGGVPVGVTERHAVTAAPTHLTVADDSAVERGRAVVAWAGPWPVDEQWWDPRVGRQRSRFQVVAADGTAWLLAFEPGPRHGQWSVEGRYD